MLIFTPFAENFSVNSARCISNEGRPTELLLQTHCVTEYSSPNIGLKTKTKFVTCLLFLKVYDSNFAKLLSQSVFGSAIIKSSRTTRMKSLENRINKKPF